MKLKKIRSSYCRRQGVQYKTAFVEKIVPVDVEPNWLQELSAAQVDYLGALCTLEFGCIWAI